VKLVAAAVVCGARRRSLRERRRPNSLLGDRPDPPSCGDVLDPRADSASIYVSTKPDRATDGSFLTENIKSLDIVTDSEIQSGQWLSETQLDPRQLLGDDARIPRHQLLLELRGVWRLRPSVRERLLERPNAGRAKTNVAL
jgi:hypothetical protein